MCVRFEPQQASVKTEPQAIRQFTAAGWQVIDPQVLQDKLSALQQELAIRLQELSGHGRED